MTAASGTVKGEPRALHHTRSLVEQATRTAHENAKARREMGKAMRRVVPEADRARERAARDPLHGELVDRAALHGVIERINSLGLELVGLHLVVDDNP